MLERPTVKVDYVAAMNRPILAKPQESRGWPIYRQAILAVGEREKKEAVDRLNEVLDARPGGEHWPKVGPWLNDHQKVVALTREGAQRPIVGFVLGKNGSINDPEVYPGMPRMWAAGEEGAVISVLLPHLSDLKLLGNIVAADARMAREQYDSARWMKDAEALIQFSEQVHNDAGFLVADLVGLGLRELALSVVEAGMMDEKLKLNDGDLQKLTHLLSKPKVAADVMDFAGERMMVLDVIQRSYTDDGNGNGHLTMHGERFLREIGAVYRSAANGYSGALFELFTVAARPALAEGRAQLAKKYEQMMNLADANLGRPMREVSWRAYENAAAAKNDQVERLREPVFGLATSLEFAQNRAERFLGHRDGIVVGISLELYRRQHGDYPSTLDVLVPQYLPQVPADRIGEGAVKYKIAKGRPLIYSVGADLDDDGGKIPAGKNARFRAANWFVSKEKAVDGDWVLFPQPEEDR